VTAEGGTEVEARFVRFGEIELATMDEVREHARKKGIELIAVPTEEACRLLSGCDPVGTAAILHVTC
jgi:hypothetical protein